MPYVMPDPYSDEDVRADYREQLIKGAHDNVCICETLRFIYDLIHDLEDKELRKRITEKLVDAFICSKAMHDRLVYYRDTYGDKTGSQGVKLNGIPNTGQRLRMRRNREIE